MSIYLEDHPPRTRQFRFPRRATPSGLIVVHTAESILDAIGEDTGAEGVASFIENRLDFGSYHTLVDSDSIIRMVAFNAEAFGDGTGSNPFAIHISFACRTTDWVKMTPAQQDAYLRNGAKAAAEAARWLKINHGVTVPAMRISKADSDRRLPGFISHAERDPARRSDPGLMFPWVKFMRYFREEMDGTPPKRIRTTITEIGKEITRVRNARKAATARGEMGPPYSDVISALKEARAQAKEIR